MIVSAVVCFTDALIGDLSPTPPSLRTPLPKHLGHCSSLDFDTEYCQRVSNRKQIDMERSSDTHGSIGWLMETGGLGGGGCVVWHEDDLSESLQMRFSRLT